MIPRILPIGFNIKTIQYDALNQYPALTSIKSGSYAEEKLYTAEKTVTFSYPYDGDNVGLIKLGSLVIYKTSSKETIPHVFIINEIDKYSSKMEFTVYAKSYSYLMNKDFINTCKLPSGTTASAFVSWLNSNATTSGITVSTNINDTLPNGFSYVGASRTKTDLIMSESTASFKRNFACYMKRGSDNIELLTRRGSDRGEILRLRDLRELRYNVSDDSQTTSVQLVCKEESDNNYISSNIVYSPKVTHGDLTYFKQITVTYDSLAREFGYNFSLSELLQMKANNYFNDPSNSGIDEPAITITLSIDEQKDIYGKIFDNYADFEFEIGDRVQVISEELGISEFNEVSALKYDGVKELVTEYVFGKVKNFVKLFYKEEFEAPKTLPDLIYGPEADIVYPEEIEEPFIDTTPEVIQNGGNPLFEIDNHNLIIEDGDVWTTPVITPTIYNTNDNKIYIGRVFWSLGDLYGPKPSHENANGEIIDGSRLKYFRYKNGQISFKLNKWLADCYASGLNETQNNWDEYDYHTHPTFSLDLFVNSTKSLRGYEYQKVTITIQGDLTDTTPLISDPLNPIEYMDYIKTTKKYDKMLYFITRKLFLAQIVITNEVNLETLFDWTTMSNFNLKVSQRLFDRFIELIEEFHTDNTPDIPIRAFTTLEYNEYRDAYVAARLS